MNLGCFSSFTVKELLHHILYLDSYQMHTKERVSILARTRLQISKVVVHAKNSASIWIYCRH